MHSALKFAFGILLASAAAAHPEQHKPASVDAALDRTVQPAAAVVDGFHAALARGDTDGALGFLADNAVIFEAGGVERSRAEYATHHLSADSAFSQAVSSEVTRRTGELAGDLAWVASEGRTTGTYKGKPIDVVTTETMVLRRSGGAWKIVHVHWSSAD